MLEEERSRRSSGVFVGSNQQKRDYSGGPVLSNVHSASRLEYFLGVLISRYVF